MSTETKISSTDRTKAWSEGYCQDRHAGGYRGRPDAFWDSPSVCPFILWDWFQWSAGAGGNICHGPFAGALIELIKILLNFVITGTSTAGVGELANFIIGCSLCVPAGLIYRMHRTRNNALIGMAVGTVCMTAIGCIVNAFVLLPTYATAFGMPIDALVEMGNSCEPQYYKPALHLSCLLLRLLTSWRVCWCLWLFSWSTRKSALFSECTDHSERANIVCYGSSCFPARRILSTFRECSCFYELSK